jgi:hypothetical protein
MDLCTLDCDVLSSIILKWLCVYTNITAPHCPVYTLLWRSMKGVKFNPTFFEPPT